VDAALDLLPQMDTHRAHVGALAASFRQKMHDAGQDTGPSSTQIVPILVGQEAQARTLAQKMAEAGFLAVAIRPPTVPPGSCRLRVVFHANHTWAQMEALADTFIRASKGMA
ncbi:aminotransferase class I/II-fold pyridoxal phosphate-dependent enzyme, partial [Acetobacter sp. DmW_125123]